jgi:farnesyl-diphosphate farnesyltransferase
VTVGLGNELLKGVSRSFYLSLRLLPTPMRPAAGIAYLLARTSDTLADAAGIPPDLRDEWLDRFESAVTRGGQVPAWPEALVEGVCNPRERLLLDACSRILGALDGLPETEAGLVRAVVATIIGGQKLDLARFSRATPEACVALADDAELEDYTWRVAGCVGLFWTKLGFATMGSDFSNAPARKLEQAGIRYGKGLQLVNILRDLPEDLSIGRCYLPVADTADRGQLLAEHARYRATAMEWVGDGILYAGLLKGRRLRAASSMPALIARDTLDAMSRAGWSQLEKRVKVPRRRIYLLLIRAFLS